ncbi:MAG: hypothetical protein D6729_04900 [Deltaproteobacteria bacterium]|nr:MAG: hypothetical protein D6729_04900 [Deltaproteobacteria bacterium]
MSSEGYHEPYELLPGPTRDLHRAISTLREEFEAVDWYQQRIDACDDPELRAVLKHNRDEEIEHACMTLEWLRRRMPKLDRELRTYLFSEGDITTVEARAMGRDSEAGASSPAAVGSGEGTVKESRAGDEQGTAVAGSEPSVGSLRERE